MMNTLVAQKIEDVFGKVNPPAQLKTITDKGGGGGISFFLNTIIELIFTFAAVAVVIMVIVGAVQMIFSGGDKEAIAGARKRITWAIIGIVMLGLSFVILRIIGQILGFEFFTIR